MGFLFFLFAVVGWAYLYSRLRRAEDRLNDAQYARARDGERIAELTRRIWTLEKSQNTTVSSIPATTPAETLAPPSAPEAPPYSERFEQPPPVVFEPPAVVV